MLLCIEHTFSRIVIFCLIFIIYDLATKNKREKFGPKRILTNTEADISYKNYIG